LFWRPLLGVRTSRPPPGKQALRGLLARTLGTFAADVDAATSACTAEVPERLFVPLPLNGAFLIAFST
jgi:hypothetical protein